MIIKNKLKTTIVSRLTASVLAGCIVTHPRVEKTVRTDYPEAYKLFDKIRDECKLKEDDKKNRKYVINKK
jgi:hypothetical protein